MSSLQFVTVKAKVFLKKNFSSFSFIFYIYILEWINNYILKHSDPNFFFKIPLANVMKLSTVYTNIFLNIRFHIRSQCCITSTCICVTIRSMLDLVKMIRCQMVDAIKDLEKLLLVVVTMRNV